MATARQVFDMMDKKVDHYSDLLEIMIKDVAQMQEQIEELQMKLEESCHQEIQ